jgi:hypothetical protein
MGGDNLPWHGIERCTLIRDFRPALASQIADFRTPIRKSQRLRADDLGIFNPLNSVEALCP